MCATLKVEGGGCSPTALPPSLACLVQPGPDMVSCNLSFIHSGVPMQHARQSEGPPAGLQLRVGMYLNSAPGACTLWGHYLA
jgi:hypothetical protein